MKKICFFNHYHNGDVFHSKPFVKDIINSINTDFYYAHSNSPVILSDLNLKHLQIPDIDHKTKFLDTEDILYVNTWVGSYFDEGAKYLGECTLRFSYEMFSKIYSEINSIFGTNLVLSDITDYFPTIDYTKFNIEKIDEYVNQDHNKKVLICNGFCLSGQCRYHGDMEPLINFVSSKYPDITFICTRKVNSQHENVKFTEDIIESQQCDLNEIGYLSTFCNLIIGRNSGPFCFSTNKDNINNPNIIFYAFGEDVTTCFLYNMDLKCEFIFEYFDNLEKTSDSILQLISKL